MAQRNVMQVFYLHLFTFTIATLCIYAIKEENVATHWRDTRGLNKVVVLTIIYCYMVGIWNGIFHLLIRICWPLIPQSYHLALFLSKDLKEGIFHTYCTRACVWCAALFKNDRVELREKQPE